MRKELAELDSVLGKAIISPVHRNMHQTHQWPVWFMFVRVRMVARATTCLLIAPSPINGGWDSRSLY